MTAKDTFSVCDIESRRPGYSMARIRAALAGRYDAAKLSEDEALLFDDLLGEAMDGTHTAEEEAFWARFADLPNTDEA